MCFPRISTNKTVGNPKIRSILPIYSLQEPQEPQVQCVFQCLLAARPWQYSQNPHFCFGSRGVGPWRVHVLDNAHMAWGSNIFCKCSLSFDLGQLTAQKNKIRGFKGPHVTLSLDPPISTRPTLGDRMPRSRAPVPKTCITSKDKRLAHVP